MHSRGILLLLSLCCAIITADQHVVNIATFKTYSQISTYPENGAASNAADGSTGGSLAAGFCSHTNSIGAGFGIPANEYHWWQVDLGRTFPVHNITVWARKEPDSAIFFDRLYPFIITVDGKICVNVTSTPITRSYSVTCSSVMYGQKVRLTLGTYRTLNLCEFQIFVCKEGFYGLDCSSPCGKNCDEGCNMTSGVCTRCKDTFWGPQFCHQNCPANCPRPTCQRDNGNCEGCKNGFFGNSCSCNANCEGGCDSTNGNCKECKPGWWDQYHCQQSCPANCYGGTCTRVDGHCSGCDRGYHGADCTKQCANRTARCAQCDQQSGTCSVCDQNFKLPDCTACVDGLYGKLCNIPCPEGCASCDQHTGTCTACNSASDSHLMFPGCTECEDGYYKQTGPPCFPCPGTCDNNTPCDKTTGHCQQCPPGRKGDTCDQECQPGYYGEGCSTRCGYCRVNTTCHHQDGSCPEGCVSGFAEPLCLQVQVKQESWVVPVVGSLAAALLITIGLVVIVCWFRRTREETEDNHQRVAPPDEPESTQDPDHPSSASPISDEDTTYEIIDKDDAEEMHVQENNYESPHPYSNDDADRALYMQLSPPASDDTSLGPH